MLLHLLCNLLFSVTTALCSMRIMTVSGYGALPFDMQSELQKSLKWFENAFHVTKHPQPVTLDDVIHRIPEYRRFSTVFVQTPEKNANFPMKSDNFQNLLAFADFTVFVVSKDPAKCQLDPGLLAEALPISLAADTRPPLAIMSICPRDRHPVPFFDLFRHEILHGMGYGLIIDKSKLTVKKSEKYTWKTPKGGQPAIRHYLDFDDFALKVAKDHFKCQTMVGVEADGERKNHLNEYIFGNELMTTDLEASGNIFSYISAAIIERTYNGKEQWYKVNQTFIHAEASQYKFAKNFGCEFLTKSCFEFINHVERSNNSRTIEPFCSRNDKNMCYGPPGLPSRHLKADCTPLNVFSQQVADNGVKPTYGFSSQISQRRFCPIIKNSQNLPPNYELGPCPGATG
uniref:Leishmanolysin-like peptidase n=1 Tax=Caenorhabditis japonica TaxID=281687 RepID=A0A8R1ENE2_CAEJA